MSTHIYDPGTDTWTFVSDRGLNRSQSGAKVFCLEDGRPIVFGDRMRSIIYDPETDTWSPDPDPYYEGPVSPGLDGYAIEKMADGRFLACGGFVSGDYTADARAWIFDPADGSWTQVASMNRGRVFHTLTRLADGKFIAIGGRIISALETASLTADLYDPDTDTWAYTGTMNYSRVNHNAVLLPTGEVLVTGGYNIESEALAVRTATERYRPSTNDFVTGDDLVPGRALGALIVVPDAAQWTAIAAGGSEDDGGSFSTIDDVQLLTAGAGGGGDVGGPPGDGGEPTMGSGGPGVVGIDIFNFSGTPDLSFPHTNVPHPGGFAFPRFHIQFSEPVQSASISGRFTFTGPGGPTYNVNHYSASVVEIFVTTGLPLGGPYTINILAGVKKASDSTNFTVLPTYRTVTFT